VSGALRPAENGRNEAGSVTDASRRNIATPADHMAPKWEHLLKGSPGQHDRTVPLTMWRRAVARGRRLGRFAAWHHRELATGHDVRTTILVGRLARTTIGHDASARASASTKACAIEPSPSSVGLKIVTSIPTAWPEAMLVCSMPASSSHDSPSGMR
jgi:hypothetical protein